LAARAKAGCSPISSWNPRSDRATNTCEIRGLEQAMGLIALVVTVCAVSQPDLCENRQFQIAWRGSLQRCAVGAQPDIARWVGEHPNWVVARWHCEYLGKQKI
jgi:hypothetical protein